MKTQLFLVKGTFNELSKIISLALLLLSGVSTIGQTDFITDYQQQKIYYDSLININGIDNMQGTGYKQNNRWFNYWAPKLLLI